MNKMTERSMGKAFASIFKFNEIAGNLGVVDYDSIDNQISFIFSELEETITAFENGDAIELLDGACDVFVTVVGLMAKLEAAGYDVRTALRKVNENNLSKFVKENDDDRLYANMHHNEQVTDMYFDKTNAVYVLLNDDGKVMKPLDFKPVDLNGLAPMFFAR